MNNFQRITASRETLAAFLGTIPAKEMWSAVKDRNEDAFAALSQEFERSSRILAEEWAQTSALAKIAVISESND